MKFTVYQLLIDYYQECWVLEYKMSVAFATLFAVLFNSYNVSGSCLLER